MPARNPQQSFLAGQARALFTDRTAKMLPELAEGIARVLSERAALPGTAREIQELQDALRSYQAGRSAWIQGMLDALVRPPLAPVAAGIADAADPEEMQLVGNEAVENRILASRLALRLLDFASWELSDLRLRIQSLEGRQELGPQDIFRPEMIAHHLVAQWMLVGMSRSVWLQVQDMVHQAMAARMLEIYHAANEFLIRSGVMAEIDLRPLVRRTPAAPSASQAVSMPGGSNRLAKKTVARPGAGSPGTPNAQKLPDATARNDPGCSPMQPHRQAAPTPTAPTTPARLRAQGVLGRLRQLLSSRVEGFGDARAWQASPQLENALSQLLPGRNETRLDETVQEPEAGRMPAQSEVDDAVRALRRRSSILKNAASTSGEKATIEIVALMFQSILAEDRIAPQIRIWFARLQMPVLRVALAEPEFFASLDHPARQLIDRMGSCALGFDVTVAGDVLESQIKRIVQVIEQYPETGRRVFQLVYEEFDRFLSRFFAEQGSVARAVSLAQQLEQKETMTVQYTIEMRALLDDLPVRDEIREFLFRPWAEVLAMSALKNGPQHAQTLLFKQAAADLVWAASAKPSRAERSRVIAGLPRQLGLLRQGMALVGLGLADQDARLKAINATMADAFMSRTDAISPEQIEAMARRLTNLEDYLSVQEIGDFPLDSDSLVTMIGIDAAHIEVIGEGGSPPTDAMRAGARELQTGSWFSLEHNGKISHVQFAWSSERKQLHLFAAAGGHSFLIQMDRLAAYLQAGLLVPIEGETLMVRATREALAKLQANPRRLLGPSGVGAG